MRKTVHKIARRITKCAGCGNRIDPDCCHCGDTIESHGMGSGHSPMPIGCTCGYAKKVKRVTRSPWSESVRKRLDATRPKYSNAVKSIAAFAKDERQFMVLVTHLDDACHEAGEDAWTVCWYR